MLAIAGRTVKGSEGSRARRLSAARTLDGHHHALFDLLDEARELRNNVPYRAGLAMPADVEESAVAVRELLVLADAYVSPHLPEWGV